MNEAIAKCQKLLEQYPNNELARFSLGKAYFNADEFVLARQQFEMALERKPDWMVVQILIGIVDLTCSAAAMYVLMPTSQHIDFVSLAVIFACATLLGFASSSPGGLGVFDAAMLVALMHYDKHSLTRFAKEAVLSSLLLFRLFYYIMPFALSLIILGIREFILDLKPVAEKISHSEIFSHHEEKPKRRKRAEKLARKKS